MQPVQPIDTVPLFAPLSAQLIALLNGLAPEDWDAPTACTPWTVKDVAAHLLGGSLGRLWPRRERADAQREPGYDDLVQMINVSNDEWVRAARRISPTMLTELLTLTDLRLAAHFAALDHAAPAGISVAWAGDERSPNWFDIAREYSEKWLHQQHIREATGRALLSERVLCAPVFDTLLRGLPHALRGVAAADGTTATVHIDGASWTAMRRDGTWRLYSGHAPGATATVTLPPDAAWRLFSRGLSPERADARIDGDRELGEACLRLVAIMA